MERLEFNGKRILRFDAENLKEIRGSVNAIFKEFKLPKDKKGTILLKPNLNNDMISLTGGTTDMRIIVAVITHLKKHGYNCHIIFNMKEVFEILLKYKRISREIVAECVKFMRTTKKQFLKQ